MPSIHKLCTIAGSRVAKDQANVCGEREPPLQGSDWAMPPGASFAVWPKAAIVLMPQEVELMILDSSYQFLARGATRFYVSIEFAMPKPPIGELLDHRFACVNRAWWWAMSRWRNPYHISGDVAPDSVHDMFYHTVPMNCQEPPGWVYPKAFQAPPWLENRLYIHERFPELRPVDRAAPDYVRPADIARSSNE